MSRHQKQRTQHLKTAAKTLRNKAKAEEAAERVRMREVRARDAAEAAYRLEAAEQAGEVISAVEIEASVSEGLVRRLVYLRPLDAVRVVRTTRNYTETWDFSPNAWVLPWGPACGGVHGYLVSANPKPGPYHDDNVRGWTIVESAGLATLAENEVRYAVSVFERDGTEYGAVPRPSVDTLAVYEKQLVSDANSVFNHAYGIPNNISITINTCGSMPRMFLRPVVGDYGTHAATFARFASLYALCCLNHYYRLNERSFRLGLRTNLLAFRHDPMQELIYGVAELDRRWDPMWRIALGWDRRAGAFVTSSQDDIMYLTSYQETALTQGASAPIAIKGKRYTQSAVYTAADNRFTRASVGRTLSENRPLVLPCEAARFGSTYTWRL